MQTYGDPNVSYAWYAANAGAVTNKSGRFISSHIAHTGLICFGAGANTLFELARYDSSLPIGQQGLVVLPHLGGLGLGVGGTLGYQYLRRRSKRRTPLIDRVNIDYDDEYDMLMSMIDSNIILLVVLEITLESILVQSL